MTIRQETGKDYSAVYRLIQEAFSSAEHRDGNEQDLVAALRKSDAFIPELSLVAEQDGMLIGHVLFTKALVGQFPVLVLAPLSVLPAYQRQGIGTALIQAGHAIAKKLGYFHILVFGSETYYPRCGYQPANQLGVAVPDGIPPANFMAIRLQEDAPSISGAVTYAKEFGL